jgi:hypothetical protein
LKIVLVLSVVALAISAVKFFQRKPTGTPAAAAADDTTVQEPAESEPLAARNPRTLDSEQIRALLLAARSNANRAKVPPPPASNGLASAKSSPATEHVKVARLPEFWLGWDGLLTRRGPPVFYRVPTQYYDELREDFGQIATATNDLKQFEAEWRTLKAAHEKDRADYLRHARATDEQRRDESSAAMKKLIDVQTLYRERKLQYEQEAARVKPRLNDPPGVFEQKLALSLEVKERYEVDITQLESALLTMTKEVQAAGAALRGFTRSADLAFDQAQAETIGRLHSLSNRVQQKLEEVNSAIRDYNSKLGSYGSPVEAVR